MVINKIRKAIEKQRPLSVEYTKADGTTSRRSIEIYDVKISQAGDVYFRVQDLTRHGSRSFRLDRITSASVLRGRVSFLTRSRAISVRELDTILSGE